MFNRIYLQVIDSFFTFSFLNLLNLTKMKKNILSAIVIFFVTFASLLAFSELSNTQDSDFHATELYAED